MMAHALSVYIFIPIVLFICAFTPGTAKIDEEFDRDVVGRCLLKCPFQNRTDDGHYDFGCGSECSVEQCDYGCSLWSRALETSCQAVCNVTTDVLSARELYCVMGCNGALNYYFQLLKEKIGTPPAPALVADSLTSTSLSLEWEGSRHSNLSYLVQWRYEELAGAWQYCRNQTWGHHSVVRVENLQPYTKYRFRVAVLLSARHSDPIVSAPSVIISTLPSGPPTSAPIELRVTALDSHRISLSWEPGPFPNGPILSYVLRIAKMERNGYTALKDLPASENILFYMFQSLSPSVTYRVGVAMRNGEGEGPQATVMVTTPEQPAAVASQQPILILGGLHTIVQQPADILAEPEIIYNTTSDIKGVGIDVRRDILFVSDSSGSIHKSSLSKISTSTAILTPSMIAYSPLEISVDWLNGHLYILGEVSHNDDNTPRGNTNNFIRWQVMRCDYEGKGQLVAFAGFHSKPVHIEVDPYNGYLFWALQGASGGLYRLDLADISNGVKHDITPDQILKDPHLGAFTVDHTNFRILVPHLKRNTVLSVSLDGREITDFRMNTQNAMFSSVQSLSFANGLFYWINNKNVLTEEYHKGQDSYFHIIYPVLVGSFNSVMVAFRSSQPIPVAANPPTGLQSVMGQSEAHISWRAPHRLGPQGAGAWQHWTYILHITTDNTTLYKTDINDSTSYTAKDLDENTVYVIKVAAVTSSGTGPWSSEFASKTLPVPRSGIPSAMLWSANQGVLRSDMTGDNVRTLIDKSHLRRMFITDISWYKDQLYMVSNSSNVMWYNTTSNEKGWLSDMENVGSLAVDWIASKLYWSSPKQQLITRGNLRGGSREPVPIVTVGKELKVDSLEGFIYWNTGHAIECARLNGEHKFTYYPAELFRKQVMGLTVDLRGKKLYWIVHGYEGTNLYKAPTADMLSPGMELSGSLVTALSGMTITGPLCYFSDRLIWLQDNSHAVISDLIGQNRANLNAVTTTHVNMIAVIDPDMQMNPVNQEVINVIPESVEPTSIEIHGDWDAFNITWDPVTRVNYGQVFYEIKIEYSHKIHKEYTTTEAIVSYGGGEVPPYSAVEMSVRAYTYWGAAAATRAALHSPQAPPTPPTRPRLFVLHHSQIVSTSDKEVIVNIVFRWERPLHANGVVRGYLVHCWHRGGGAPSLTTLPAQQYQYTARGVPSNTTYYCQVQAYTDAGDGPKTHIISAVTNVESPIPKLAISFFDSIKVVDLDLGAGYSYTVSRSPGKPEDFAVALQEGLIYWMNQEQEIYMSRMDETGHTKILSINGTALSLTVDWVARMLYWSQIENSPDQYECMLYRMDLNAYSKEGLVKLEKILQRNLHVKRLQVSPVTRSLYWIEMNHHGLGKLMTSDIDGSNIRPFFNGLQVGKNNSIDPGQVGKPCNCPENPAVGLGFTVDLTDPESRKIYWVDAWLKHITSSDLNGCYCKVVVNATRFNDHALPPSSITVDSKYIYWTNSSQKQMYSVEKNAERLNQIHHINITNGQKIVALGSKIQPYPPKNCLYPKQMPLAQVTLLNSSSSSLTLDMPKVVKHEFCDIFSMATPYYTIYYQPYSEDESLKCEEAACTTIRTFETKLHLAGLKPFSKYVFSVQINNYYRDLIDAKPIVGPPVVFRTSAGAPASALDVRAQVLSPHHARVEWLAPLPSTGVVTDLDIWHEIHWRTEGSFTPNHRVKEHTFIAKTKSPSNQSTTQADLLKLMPSQSYSVWVRTCSFNSDVFTDSETVSIETYPEPNGIQMTFVGTRMMHVSWMPYRKIQTTEHHIEYAEKGSDIWKTIEDEGSKKSDGSINYVVQKLLPKTKYMFRIKIVYVNNTTPYIWPIDTSFIFETLGDRPSAPGKPVVQHLSGSVYQLQWSMSAPHGSAVILYRLNGCAKPSEGERIRTHRDVQGVLDMYSSQALNSTEQTIVTNHMWMTPESFTKELLPKNHSLTENKPTFSKNSDTIEALDDFDNLANQIAFGEMFTFKGDKERNRRKANFSEPQADLPHFSVEDNADSMLIEVTDELFEEGCKMLYNGTDNYWIIADLKLSERYTFFVEALNSYGWSGFSERSEEFDFSEAEMMIVQQDYLGVILGIGISIIGALAFGIGVCVYLIKRRDKKLLGHSITLPSALRGPDMELATLRELPRSRGGGGMFQQSVLYGRGLGGMCGAEGDMGALTHIRRDQIKLSKFLGSGAFGEVFEGKSSETRVAIKTLRKGATDQEKAEFLQEAQLMTNFRHRHILSLLGVCLDNDPHFIILELMEAGDLLGYLRARRPMLYTNDSLTLHDLLSMCLDVTRGCCYLEEMHFVHRDLACRNCLVSHQPDGRIVKIGDFGLTRDIYKNDYYRKEGEGLLPVRWMAVECLTDGVFSRASDVWAWAVLCWEVCTLGMQPYAALSNHAVMRYVQGGGTLLRPINCPQELFDLMQKCWSYNPDHRPTFKHCLEVLEHMKDTLDGDTVLTVSINDEPQYITVVADGVSNRAYFMDENQNNFSGDADFINESTQISPEASRSIAVVTEGPPKYLELIYHGESLPMCLDGYEVPRSSIRSNSSRKMFNGDTFNSATHVVERRQSFNTMDNRNSISRIPLNRSSSTSRHSDNGRLISQIPTSATVQVHTPNGLKVRVLESNLNGVIRCNSFTRPSRISGQFNDGEYQPDTSQKLIPNGILKNSNSRTNSGSSRTSDDIRLSNPTQSEQRRLLNHLSGAPGTGERCESNSIGNNMLRTIT